MRKANLNYRAIAVFAAFAVLFVLFALIVLFDQRSDAADSAAGPAVKTYDVVVHADRGEILDRSGNTFVYNEQINTIDFNALTFPQEDDARNEEILTLIRFLESREEEWIDRLPIRRDSDGVLAFEEDREADISWMRSDKFLDLNDYATAENCLDALKEMFGLQTYAEDAAIKIASVRYNMTRLGFSATAPYTFAKGISIQSVAYIKENGDVFKGVDARIVSSRKYIGDGSVAAHLLGIVGAINKEEYDERTAATDLAKREAKNDPERVRELDLAAYTLNDDIGKNGLELAMEPYLKGRNGVKTVSVTADGDVSEEMTVPAHAGGTVITTLDLKMQQIAEASLRNRILQISNEKPLAGGLTPAGAVVVENVNTGAILASASYPTFPLADYYEKYEELAADTGNPLWNRAFQSGYSPGSTMKPATAIAGLEEGFIEPDSHLFCNGTYQYIDQTFVCFGKTAHGSINVDSALAYSCNIFFFEIAKNLGIQKLNQYASLLGLGQKTGVEINETEGLLAGYEERESRGLGWKAGETLLAAIGQSDNSFSALQLTNYCATIANGGTRYVPFLVSKVLSSDFSEVLYEREPQVAVNTNISERTLDAVKSGMYQVANVTSCREQLGGLKYKVACKTGTAEKTRIINGWRVEGTDGFLIAFGPYADPEIAITVVVENAGSGATTAQVAADIFEYYFSTKGTVQNVQEENVLL